MHLDLLLEHKCLRAVNTRWEVGLVDLFGLRVISSDIAAGAMDRGGLELRGLWWSLVAKGEPPLSID